MNNVESLIPVLRLLSDGAVHSGAVLGGMLGVSRAAVWKQLQRLHELGLVVESVKGRGYCLRGGLELLNREQILQGLGDSDAALTELQLALQVPSTNALLLEQLAAGRGHAVALLAEQQIAGRGRRGREWLTPFGGGIALSIGWRFDGGVQLLEGLSLAVGAALAQALESLGVEGVQLKWPNDVLCKGKKLAGILLEVSGDLTDRCAVVIGVGLNMRLPEAQAQQIDQPWIDLHQIAPQVGRNRVCAALLRALTDLLQAYPRTGFAAWREAWQERDAFAGQSVQLHAGPNHWEGIARGVSADGALRLEVDGEVRVFSGGEVSLRPRTTESGAGHAGS